ncbi:MAG: SDR family oxidoreductase [Bacteroidetes bacterium]|nr:SDR family oxidoreductase [Bacteroidota bacterium]
MDSILKHKVIWITGASSGIGRALAIELAKYNTRLVLSARNMELLEQTKQFCKLPPNDILIIPFDLKNTSNAITMAAQIINTFGSIDVLINNGGQSQRSKADETPLDFDRDLMEVNYFSAVALTKAVTPYMKRQKSGKIIVVSSIAGKFGFYLRSSYSAAKHALHGFFESYRLETEKLGISTLIVCPGKIKTNISLSALNNKGELHGVMDPSHINATSPEECAKQIINAVLNNKQEIFIGGKELILIKLKRFFPKLFNKIIRKQSPY